MEEKITAAKIEVKESFGAGTEEPTEPNGTPSSHCSNGNGGEKSAFGGEKQQGQQQQPESDILMIIYQNSIWQGERLFLFHFS